MELEIEYISEFRMDVFKSEPTATGWKQLSYVGELDFGLQTTLDGEIFLQVQDESNTVKVDLTQQNSFFFLEKLLECEGYYTFEGEAGSHDTAKADCEGMYISMTKRLDELWSLRETMLYWLSYGG